MSKLHRLLLARKRNDRIKIEWLLWFGTVLFGGIAIYRGIVFYQYIQTPVEYELMMSDSRALSDACEEAILQMPGAGAVTEYAVSDIIFHSNGDSVNIKGIAVSKDYIKAVCHQEAESGMMMLYVNQAAYQAIQGFGGISQIGQASEWKYADGEEAAVTLQCPYEYHDKMGIAKLTAADIGHEGELTGYFVLDSITLNRERQGLRVWFDHRDIDGSQVRELQSMGYSFLDENDLKCKEYEKQMHAVRIRDCGVLSLLLMVMAVILHKYGM